MSGGLTSGTLGTDFGDLDKVDDLNTNIRLTCRLCWVWSGHSRQCRHCGRKDSGWEVVAGGGVPGRDEAGGGNAK
jgi:hypothetical protein